MGDVELRVEIDPYKLEEEWQNQPTQVRRWRDIVADRQEALDIAKSTVDLRKDAVKEVEARLYLEISNEPEEYNLKKTTDAVVSHCVRVQPEFRAALKRLRIAESEVIDARKALGLAESAVEALVDRKRSLSYMSEFWFHDYYAEPKNRQRSTDEKRSVRQRGQRRREVMEDSSG